MDQQNNNIYPGGRYDIGRDSYFRPNTSDSLSANWERLPTDLRAAINTVFSITLVLQLVLTKKVS